VLSPFGGFLKHCDDRRRVAVAVGVSFQKDDCQPRAEIAVPEAFERQITGLGVVCGRDVEPGDPGEIGYLSPLHGVTLFGLRRAESAIVAFHPGT
jgi:hypothetical protein